MNPVPVIPWYQSPVYVSQIVTFLSAALAIFPKLATALGLTSTDLINQTVTTVFGFVAVVATAYGAIKRAKSPVQPLTLTKAAAEVHPQTIAAKTVTGGK